MEDREMDKISISKINSFISQLHTKLLPTQSEFNTIV